MNRQKSRTLRAAAALGVTLSLVTGFSYQGQSANPSVSVPAGATLHGQGIWASMSISVTCTPDGNSVSSGATLTQVQDGRTVQAFSSHSDTCTGKAISVPLQFFGAGHVLRPGTALLQVVVGVQDGGDTAVTRTVKLTAGDNPIINSDSTRIGGKARILGRVPVVVSVPVSLNCPTSEGTTSPYLTVFQRSASGVINAGSGNVPSICNGQWNHHSAWVTIQAGRWHTGPAWAVINDASRPVTIVMGSQS